MTPQDPLAALHPLREPAVIGWWPPAPGWWLLLAICLIGIALLAYVVLRKYRLNAYRRRALQQLLALHNGHRETGDDQHYIEQINALLKSVALAAYPRAEVAARHGESWRTFLNSNLPPERQLDAGFDHAVYQEGTPQLDTNRLHAAAQHWIKHHKVAS